MYELRHEISVFMEKKGGEVPAFTDLLLMSDFAFLEQLINELCPFVSAFKTRFRLWETQPRDANYFPTLIENKPATPDT